MMELLDRLKGDGPTALGACIFAGGFSLGMESAGFNVAGHLELTDLALGASVSRQRWPVVVSDIDGWKAALGDARPDVFYANPPCVAYAGTGKRLGVLDDRMCYTRYVTYDMAWHLRPKVWVWELVPGVFDHEVSSLHAMAFRAKALGYRCWAFLTSSALHGGFQDRRRFHFIASRVDLDFQGVYDDEPPQRRGVRTLGDALDAIPEGVYPNNSPVYKGCFNDIIRFCPPGAHLRSVPRSIMARHYRPEGREWSGTGLPGFAHTRGRLDRPCPNILGGHTVFHPVHDRYLTPRESATVMGFPLDYRFSDGAKAYAEIGKGLCTHNAEFVSRVIMRGLQMDSGTVPTQSPDGTWLGVVDWRSRVERASLKLTTSERNAWWRERHGELPPEWAA